MNNIKKLRNRKRLTLVELADRLNSTYAEHGLKFSKATIDRWEKELSSPSITHASALADFFDVTLDEIAAREEMDYSNDESTVAAHIDDDVTEEEMEEIRKYIDYIKSKRDQTGD